MEHKLTIFSSLDEIPSVEKFIDDFVSHYKIDDFTYSALMPITLEAVANGIKHGNKSDENKQVFISLSISEEDEKLVLSVEDQGEGFDFNNIPDPTAPENLEKLNGRGVYIMRQMAEKVEYKNNGSTVCITMTFTKK